MKAVIMEIHKDYCIVVTEDGRFLKRKIPAGVFEVGDEIVIDQELSFEPAKAPRASWFGRYAATAVILVVIIAGVIIGVRYIRQYYSAGSADLVTEYKAEEAVVGEEETEQALVAARDEEEAGEEEEVRQEGTVVYTDTYLLNEEDWIEEKIRGIIFAYRVADGTSLEIQLENVSSTPYFSGTFELFMRMSDTNVARVISISVENLEPGDIQEESYPIEEGELSFRLEVFEEF